GHGDRRRYGHADRPGVRGHSSDRVAGSPARLRRSAPGGLWRGGHFRCAVHARWARAGGPRRRRKNWPEAAHMSTAAATAITTQTLLQAQGLHKNFGGVKAVSDISFDVPAGSIFAVIGPNGAGKSTLLNLISGVYQANAGSLSFKGTDLSRMPAHRRVRLGIARTFQKIRLFKQLSVLE